MKKILTILAGAALVLPSCCSNCDETEKKVNKILKGLTLEEKIGQMMQINATVICEPGTYNLNENAEKVLREYKVGSILNTPHDEAATPAEYRQFIRQIQDIALDATGIPVIYGLDQIHGASYTIGAVLFPQELTLASSFNDELAYEMGEVCAYETRACNVQWVFTPTLDLSRNQCWPRMWESYGEDPYLQTRMGVQQTLGLQGGDGKAVDENHVAVSIKHFMAYGAALSGQDRTPSMVTYREMKEKYFPPFKACAEAGALTVMVNSSNNDGIPFHTNEELLTNWLKKGLDWDGFIVTDWADIRNVFERDHSAESYKDAIRQSINAGVDMVMEPYDVACCDLLKELVLEKKVPMSRIDDAVRRILRVKIRLGLFDDPYGEKGDYSEFGAAEAAQKAYRAALESEVLLKNEGVLPLSKDANILLVGPNANEMRCLGGGWNYTWQGHKANEPRFTAQYNTIYEALKAKFRKVTYVPALEYNNAGSFEEEIRGDYSAAVRAARNADVIVACIGENTYCESVGNMNDLNLSRNQKELVAELAKTGKPIVLILNEGRPRVLNEIEPLAKAVVDIILPGNYGADALASLLCGEENFSAKLPFTYPKYVNRLNTYDYKLCESRETMAGLYNYDANVVAQWPFGHGLSYTTFEYSNLRTDRKEFRAGDVIKVCVDVKNTGKVAGKEPVLLFSSDLYASITPDVKRLRNFTKISLEPGETKTVEFEVKASDLAFVNHNLDWVLEPGDFRLAVGSESTIVTCVK